ncbi:MAG: glycosyltransferase family 4 protein [Lachnospiraceae bacterium]|nr:glycosyltransferase family 4 protein [Lachnospiraceae bacterium]
MKILFLTHYDAMYGANKALLSLLLALKERGKDVLLGIPGKGKMTKALEAAGIPYIICELTPWEAPYVEPISFIRKKAKRKKKIADQLAYLYEQTKDLDIDVVHSNTSVLGTGAMLAEKLGCKHVWHIREYGWEHYGNYFFYPAKMVQDYYEKAAAVITISDALAENKRKKYPSANIVRIYDGVTLEEPVKKEDEDRIVRFIYIGYLFPMKHQMDVLKACDLLKQQRITNFQMIFAGGGGNRYEKKLKAFQKRKGLDNVTFAGYVEKPYELLQKCDVGIIASEYEGFGLVTVEYMLHGLPVLGRKSGATPELVKDGETGVLFDSPEELAKRMEQMIEDAPLRVRLGEAGEERAKTHFSMERSVEELITLYEKI